MHEWACMCAHMRVITQLGNVPTAAVLKRAKQSACSY